MYYLYIMNKFKDYFNYFSEEDVCVCIIKEFKEQQGILCKNCGSETHYWKNDKKKFECKECNYRTSLKKDTVMENSNLPIQYWLTVIAFLSTTDKNISALKIQKELGHNRYEPILRMVKKIKRMPETDLLKQILVSKCETAIFHVQTVLN